MFCRYNDKVRLVPSTSSLLGVLDRSQQPAEPEREPVRCKFCPSCEDIYTSDTELEMHKQRKHKQHILKLFDKNRYTCRMCLRKRSSKADLLRHFKPAHLHCYNNETRIHRETFVCDECKNLFFSKHMLVSHMALVHKLNTPDIVCPRCKKTVKVKSSYMHFEAHLMTSVNACPICFVKFNSRKMLHLHVQSYHSCSFHCTQCSYETRKHRKLVFHKAKHHAGRAQKVIVHLDTVKKYFIVRDDAKKITYVAPLATRGVSLHGTTNLCVLCCALCADEREMVDHYMDEHVAKAPH